MLLDAGACRRTSGSVGKARQEKKRQMVVVAGKENDAGEANRSSELGSTRRRLTAEMV